MVDFRDDEQNDADPETSFRPLDPERRYYSWGEFQGRLSIESECCADSFSHEEEAVLLAWLTERASRRGEVEA